MASPPRISARLIYGAALFGVGLLAVFLANVRLLELQSEARAGEPVTALELIGLICVALVGLTIGGDSLRASRRSRQGWTHDSIVRALSVIGFFGFVAVSIFAEDSTHVGPIAAALLLIAIVGGLLEFRTSRRKQRMKKRRWNARRVRAH